MKFKLEHTDGKARAGRVETDHGVIETPIFMPVGTRASVKSIWAHELKEMNAQIILSNTYHLHVRPGEEIIHEMGGLHAFMNWDRPVLTDSGGFQIFSLSELNKISEEGVRFRSHLDGRELMLSPEKSMEIQRALSSDIVMIFDDCPPLPSSPQQLEASVQRTLRWAKRCLEVELSSHQNLFAIVQGGLDLDLRKYCLDELNKHDFPGLAIGGLSVGEKNEEMRQLLEDFVDASMPQNKPRYLMGVGRPLDILHAISQGVDMFDCVLPTRNARNGQFLTHKGPLNIKNKRFELDKSAPDPDCSCKVCQNYSRAYIRHLFTVGEYLAGQMISYHNLHFYLEMTTQAREAIVKGEFASYYKRFKEDYESNAYR